MNVVVYAALSLVPAAFFVVGARILDWWVREVIIVVDQEEGKLRASAKYALVFLRTAPTEGIDRLVSGTSIVEGTKGTSGTR